MHQNQWHISDAIFEADEVSPLMKVLPWNGHRRFAYDLVRFLAPECLVELGTHSGTSFFAFCQAVKDARLSTRCIAVDTWKGDQHTGPYDESVYGTVRSICDRFFADVDIRLFRMLFAESLAEVPPESVDILHIDGCHTYEAVSNDYHSWLCKLRPQGVVLLHDVSSASGYGSCRFWRELSESHPHFEFPHSWGLGVLFPKGDRAYQQMAAANFDDKLRLYQYWAEFELSRIKLADLSRMADERFGAIQAQSRMIQERDAVVSELQTRLRDASEMAEDRLVALRRQSEMLASQIESVEHIKAQLADAAALAESRYAAIQEQSQMIAERNITIADLQRRVTEAEALAGERYGAIQDQSQMIAERNITIVDLQRRVTEAEALAGERYGAIQDQSQMIAERDVTIADLQQRLTDAAALAENRYAAIQEQSQMIAERDATISDLRQRLAESGATKSGGERRKAAQKA